MTINSLNAISQVLTTKTVKSWKDYIPENKNTPIFEGYKLGETEFEKKVKEDTARVSYIIGTDEYRYKINEDKMVKRIMDAASYAGVSPALIACIVKNETHFCEEIIISENGKGPMGLTSIALDDLYTRPSLFDSSLEKLIKQYGSLNKLFAAKRKKPSLNLGNLGEILYKYQNSEKLKKAVCKDFDLNLKVGAFVFKGFLKEQGYNLYKTFYRYNNNSRIDKNTGHEIRQDYAKSAVETYQQAIRNATKLRVY